jgi:hypothetical protein
MLGKGIEHFSSYRGSLYYLLLYRELLYREREALRDTTVTTEVLFESAW